MKRYVELPFWDAWWFTEQSLQRKDETWGSWILAAFMVQVWKNVFVQFQPSRELAEQTHNQIKLFKKFVDNPTPKELLVIGGVSVKEQIAALQSGVSFMNL